MHVRNSGRLMFLVSARDWRIFREDYNISTKGGKIPSPLRYWNEAPLSDDLLKVIEGLHYDVSTVPF